MLDTSYYEKTDQIIAQYSCEEKSLIPIIQGIQEEYRYLPPELLTYVAGKLGILTGLPSFVPPPSSCQCRRLWP